MWTVFKRYKRVQIDAIFLFKENQETEICEFEKITNTRLVETQKKS